MLSRLRHWNCASEQMVFPTTLSCFQFTNYNAGVVETEENKSVTYTTQTRMRTQREDDDSDLDL
jgi:hypothetical protein